jgi:hypothetical protein
MAYKRGPSKASIAKGREERYRRIEEMRQKTNERLRKKSAEEQDVPGMRVGGMCRGMGAAIKGGKFGGVK